VTIAAANDNDTAAVSQENGRSMRGTILIVDDEPLLLRAFSRVLMRQGHEVVQASDGTEAATQVAKRRFDCAFVDLGLPGAGGLEVLAALRARDPALPVILMTGMPTMETAIDAVAAGAMRYLIKPIDSPDLQEAALDAIRMRRREDGDRYDRRKRDEVANAESLDRAFESLFMVYQPIARWGRREVYAYEALVRTREPSVPHPGALLDIAQRCDRLPELGRRIRRLVAATASSSLARLFVNLHPVDLLDDDLYDQEAPLSRHARRVVLEVTERAGLENIDNLADRLRRLRALGFRVAIDDLGEGYAGLTSLARVAPEFVKLDMSLVRGIDSSVAQQQIVASTVQLCRALGSEIIAEGVETVGERDALVAIGLDLLQGYLIARPAPELMVPSLS
jgi:EAL domain-containing protein (putative c-di-GMP-specific phosphodiesterase class I)